MVKSSNTGCKFIAILFGIPLLLGFLIIEPLLIYSTIQHGDLSTLVIDGLILAIITLVPPLIITILLRRGARYNRRRQAAAQHDPTALTYHQQPIVNAQIPALPITITLYPTVQARLVLSLISLVLITAIFVGDSQHYIPFHIWPVIFWGLGLVILIWQLWWMIFIHPALHINVTDNEIQMSKFGEESSIEWEDARLFSVFAVKGYGDNV